MENYKKKICPICHKNFLCYTKDCWCSKFPNIMPFNSTGECLCFNCLKTAIEKRIEDYHNTSV